MSTVKSKNLQIGTDGTASNNFTIYQPGTPDGTLRVGNGNAGAATDVAKIDSDGFKFTSSIQIGTNATSTNNFTIYQPATPDGTLRIGVGNADSPTEVGRFDSNGYVATNAPAFKATFSTTQTVLSATFTKMAFDTEEFDTNSNYDTTNYRFTPSVAGYYSVNIGAYVLNNTRLLLNIYKNGALNEIVHDSSISEPIVRVNGTTLLYMNGTTDYIEAWVYIQGTTLEVRSPTLNGTKFEAHLARAS